MLNQLANYLSFAVHSPAQAVRQTPTILLNRLQGRTPLDDELPWMPFAAIDFLKKNLKPTDHVLEFGSGGSTLFFARRVARVVSIEHDPEWGDRVRTRLKTLNLTNVDYRIIPPEPGADPATTSAVAAYKGMNFRRYVGTTQEFAKASFNLAVADGRVRNQCAEAVLPLIKPGGMLLLDNADRGKYAPTLALLQPLQNQRFRGLNPYQLDPGESRVWWVG